MNWKQKLFKPKWQHKKAEVRLAAIKDGQDPELINRLLEIASNDVDSRVRSAAINRIHRLDNLLNIFAGENDPEVKNLLENKIHHLAGLCDESRPALDLRIQVANKTNNRNLIEHLAKHAPEADLRRIALTKVKRQGVLGDCCFGDQDADNRRYAANRITQHKTLKRVIAALRKTDKALYAELQNRLQQELLQQKDPAAIYDEALAICQALEKLAIGNIQGGSVEADDLHKRFSAVATLAGEDMNARYKRVCERLSAPAVRTPPIAESTTTVDETQVIEPFEVADKADEKLAGIIARITDYQENHAQQPEAHAVEKFRKQIKYRWQALKVPHPLDEIARQQALFTLNALENTITERQHALERALSTARQQLTLLEQQLEDGELHNALETCAELQQEGKKHAGEWQVITRKLASLQPRLRELRDWQHWSNNKIRARLIAEMELLPTADLHPDALLDRIKSLQKEWKVLEDSEQIPGDRHFSASAWMWRKFSAAGHVAYDTARPFLDKRSEIQTRQAESLATFCVELQQLTQQENIDWSELAKAINRGRKKLRELGEIHAKQRQKLAVQLKSALESANTAMQGHYAEIEQNKMKLIRAAGQLTHLSDNAEAISQAKSLQSSWKATGRLWRSKEQALWEQFREHLDPLFKQLKTKQAGIRAKDAETLAEQKALCDALRAILENKENLLDQRGKVQGLNDEWKDIEYPDRKLQQVFQNLLADFQSEIQSLQQKELATARERWWLKSSLLHYLASTVDDDMAAEEILKKIKADWPDASSDDSAEQLMDEHLSLYLSGSAPVIEDDLIDRARALCIGLEFIAGLSSPKDESKQRMQYQVDRLAESMSSAAPRQPAKLEARQAEKIWLGMYALPSAEFEAFGRRVKAALSAIRKSVNAQ